MRKKSLLPFLICVLLAVSCSVKKHVPSGKKLLVSTSVDLKTDAKIKDESGLKSELEGLLTRPNSKILGMRVGLWAHERTERKKGKFLTRYLNKRYGEAPVYLDQVSGEKTIQLIHNRLENRGFFGARVEESIGGSEKTARINYTVYLPEPYLLDTFMLMKDSINQELYGQIRAALLRTKLVKGTRYDLEKLKAERERIDDFLKNKGYYNFTPDMLIFRVDTNWGTKSFRLHLSVKKDLPADALLPYRIRDIYVYPDYSVEDTFTQDTGKTIHEGVYFIQREEAFRPRYLRSYILLKKGDLYSKRRQNLTSNRLSSIGNYRYVNVRYKKVEIQGADSSKTGYLDARIFLSPLNKQSLRLEMQGLTKSNNFVGPALLTSYHNRNLFRGGELLTVRTNFGFETQLAGGRQTGLNSYEAGIESELIIPRMLLPFKTRSRNFFSVPKTAFSLSFSVLNRVQFYGLNSVLASYGYRWNSSRLISHKLDVVSVNFIRLSRTTPAFDEILLNNAFLRRSFEQQLIVGPSYSFRFNELNGKEKRSRFFVTANLDLAGNMLSMLQGGGGGGGNKTLLGQSYAQYQKIDLDIRHYLQLNKSSRLVSRVFAGVGFPGNNSLSLPYIKQFFSGGPNSIRAFRIRSLGPGSYRPQSLDIASFFDQVGDVKLEANAEYRFPLISVLKGALFIDVGNIWLLNENNSLPGGKLSSNWANELAVGTGIGFRIDVDFFVIRLDASSPLRTPWEGWVSDFSYGKKAWRRQNLIWNFAIGYPF
jgi:outer membrane protein insertion porin family